MMDSSRGSTPASAKAWSFGLVDTLVVATWAAVTFGFIEGALLDVARYFPRVLAPFKATAHQLWVAPAVDTVYFALVAPWVHGALRVTNRWTGEAQPRLAIGAFVFLGAAIDLLTLHLLHWLAAVTLAFGVAVAVTRAVEGRERQAVAWLRRHIVALPILVALAAVAVTAVVWLAENARLAAGGAP
jgi:hypothetical protein